MPEAKDALPVGVPDGKAIIAVYFDRHSHTVLVCSGKIDKIYRNLYYLIVRNAVVGKLLYGFLGAAGQLQNQNG